RVVVALYTIEENVKRFARPYVITAVVQGFSHHFCVERYHFIIAADDDWVSLLKVI
ncbi:hypothetical protein Leryth_002917, partial [Lithospermum erythrorhizon]